MNASADILRPPRWTLADTEQSCVAPFERLAAQHPDRLAVCDGNTSVSYGELNARANRLAQALIAHGTYGDRVALALGHDAAMITGLLATWKAGMVAVPLEMSHPIDRLATIVADAGCALIVTEPTRWPVSAELARNGANVLPVTETGNDPPASDPQTEVDPGHLACLVYTSGSTGRPKGVMQTHRQAVRNVIAYSNMIGIVPDDRIVLLASCAAAQGMSTVVCALSNGASLFPFGVREAGSAEQAVFIRQHAITLYISAATIFRHLMATLGKNEVLDSIRMVRLGSEPIVGSDAAAFRRHFRPDCVLLTALSSTETSNITLYRVDLDHDANLPSLPVGWPVDGMEVLLLDEAGEDVGIEREGEIVVRSRYLSPGYWQDAPRTAITFRDAGDGTNRRCYHTGDLGRRRADGCLIHAGRRDFRVKVRGFGIELEEVETTLRQHPLVQAAVASVRSDKLGDSTLVAHLVVRAEGSPTLEDLQRHLRAKLAAPMVPTEFFVVPTLPLAPNGKMDRQLITMLDGVPLRPSAHAVPPRTPHEQQLLGAWESVLSHRPISVEDDFFAIGGNSLLAGLVISRVATAYMVELPLREFLQHPTIAGLARIIRHRRLDRISAGGIGVVRTPRDRPLPASFAQQRLWLLDQIEPGSNAYNVARAIRLEGRLNHGALDRALREIVRRHETLRTTFASVDDQSVQVIAEPGAFTLTTIAVEASPESDGRGDHQFREQLDAEAMRPFDLTRGPLFRATLYRLGSDRHVLLLSLHHIISDLWSNAVLTRELSELYTAFSQNQPSPLLELTVQYTDYAGWQRNRIQGAFLQRQRAYWSAQLAGLPALDLPTDRPRSRTAATASAVERFELAPELTRALGQLAHDQQCTLYMTLLAVFQTLLHRHAGQEDFAVGGVVAGRNRVEVENLIGFFINTLVHRADVSGDPTFRELLARVRETALGAFDHQDLPFERLVEELNPPRDLNRTPFFQVAFLLQNTPRTTLAMPGLTVTNVETAGGAAKFDLTFSLHEIDGGLQGSVEFNPALFDRTTVQRLIGHYRTLCASAVSHPSHKVARLEMLSVAEREALITNWQCPPRNPPGEGTLVTLFEDQVRLTPLATALVAGTTRWSFSALDQAANRLAHLLRAKGVRPDSLVGVCLDRGSPLIVTLLGILKAGGAYVPLDPAHPPSRLRMIMDDAALSFLVTQSSLRERFGAQTGETICVDLDAAAISAQPESPPAPGMGPANLAYVIYTSGSTGRPKGVAVEHRNVVALMDWARATYTADELSGVLASTSVCFDISVFELFAPLCCGGAVHLAPNVLEISGMSSAREVTLITTVSSAIVGLLDSQGLPPSVRVVNLGGEPLPTSTVDRLYALPHVQKVYDLYGPTETTVFSTFALRRAGAPATIGRPLMHEQVYILDRCQQPVPIGAAGEMYIGGAGVARGYWGRPELNAERFRPDPFAARPGARVFRTGDLGRFHRDGSIEFLGRLDHQVKIRGYRIELGEIETPLAAHPEIRQAIVIARETATGDKQLIGYVVLHQNGHGSTSELQDFLRSKLPEYMVPSLFIPIPSVPLGATGKVDRKALPDPDATLATTDQSSRAPRTPTEESLVAIWSEVLKREDVGVHDDFFAIGGHSLVAMKVVSQVRWRLGAKIALRALFDHPTVAALADAIERMQTGGTAPPEPDMDATDTLLL